ncbi:MAG TPA: YebC/PmpR family DNA-binding transcriptional regulator, partial [Parachlamydiales bacterium]|nr:YebC/PmpR family DNA-binding transcriptional regulator [Parachlamydiales bacterium]
LVSENGADDVIPEEESNLIYTPSEAFYKVKEAIEAAAGRIEEAELAMVPKIWVEVNAEDADKNIALIEWLENLDDVDAVYHNMKIS